MGQGANLSPNKTWDYVLACKSRWLECWWFFPRGVNQGCLGGGEQGRFADFWGCADRCSRGRFAGSQESCPASWLKSAWWSEMLICSCGGVAECSRGRTKQSCLWNGSFRLWDVSTGVGRNTCGVQVVCLEKCAHRECRWPGIMLGDRQFVIYLCFFKYIFVKYRS